MKFRFSIYRDATVDLFSPGSYATLEVAHLAESFGRKELDCTGASHAYMTVYDNI